MASDKSRVLVDVPEIVYSTADQSGISVSQFIEIAAIEKAQNLAPKKQLSKKEVEELIERLTNPTAPWEKS